MTGKKLMVDPRLIRPLPPSMWDSSCSRCDRRQARWELGFQHAGEVKYTCSLCFLYHSKWGQDRAAEIADYLLDVEAERGEKFLRAADGVSLLSCKDADHALAAIVLVSRIPSMMKGAEGGQQ